MRAFEFGIVGCSAFYNEGEILVDFGDGFRVWRRVRGRQCTIAQKHFNKDEGGT